MPQDSSKNSLEIKIADMTDVSGILEVQRQHLLNSVPQDSLNELQYQGFISYEFKLTELKAWIQNPDDFLVLVAIRNDTVIGYTIGGDVDHLPSSMYSDFSLILEGNGIPFSGKIFYHKQIATNMNTEGIGTLLLKKLFKLLKRQHYVYTLCLIAQSPFYNLRSVAFHQKMGFELVGTVQDHNNIDGIYLKYL